MRELRARSPERFGSSIAEGPVIEIEFHFKDYVYDTLMDAFNSLERMVVVGERVETYYQALDVQPAADVSTGSPLTEGTGS